MFPREFTKHLYLYIKVNSNNLIQFDNTPSSWIGPSLASPSFSTRSDIDYTSTTVGTIYYRSMTRSPANENQFATVDNLLNLFSGISVSGTWMFVCTFDNHRQFGGAVCSIFIQFDFICLFVFSIVFVCLFVCFCLYFCSCCWCLF